MTQRMASKLIEGLNTDSVYSLQNTYRAQISILEQQLSNLARAFDVLQANLVPQSHDKWMATYGYLSVALKQLSFSMNDLGHQIEQQSEASRNDINHASLKIIDSGISDMHETFHLSYGLFSFGIARFRMAMQLARWSESSPFGGDLLKGLSNMNRSLAASETKFGERIASTRLVSKLTSTLKGSLKSRIASMGRSSVKDVSIPSEDVSVVNNLDRFAKGFGVVGIAVSAYTSYEQAKGPTEVRVADAAVETGFATAGAFVGSFIPIPVVGSLVGGYVGNLAGSWVAKQAWFNDGVESGAKLFDEGVKFQEHLVQRGFDQAKQDIKNIVHFF